MSKARRRGRKARRGEQSPRARRSGMAGLETCTTHSDSRSAGLSPARMHLKSLLKRGALLAAANWPVIAIQYVAATTFQVLLAVPVIGAAILVAVLLGADLAELLQGSLRDTFTAIAGT